MTAAITLQMSYRAEGVLLTIAIHLIGADRCPDNEARDITLQTIN